MGLLNKMADGNETVGDGLKIEPVLKEIFQLMDDNGDQAIDEGEGIAIGMAMGESEEQAKKSWIAMCKDMDDDGNTTIEEPGPGFGLYLFHLESSMRSEERAKGYSVMFSIRFLQHRHLLFHLLRTLRAFSVWQSGWNSTRSP